MHFDSMLVARHPIGKHYHCQEYPDYHFASTGAKDGRNFKVTVLRGLDSLLVVDLLVGERLTLVPLSSGDTSRKRKASAMTGVETNMKGEAKGSRYLKEEAFFICKIMTIDQSANGRRCDITVDTL